MASLIIDPDDDILTKIHTAEVSAADMQTVLGRPLSQDETRQLADFEKSWKYFVSSKRGTLPVGKQGTALSILQEKLDHAQATHDNVQAELEKQISFFKENLVTMESEYREKMEYEKKHYETTEKKLLTLLRGVQEADKIQVETLTWFFFLSCVEAEAAKKFRGHMPKTRALKPSSRAKYLLSRLEREADDREALEMDHALLKAHLRMLNKEIQRYEKTLAAQEHAANVLTENDIWSVLK